MPACCDAGGSAQALYVDNANKVILVATFDKLVRSYDLQSKHLVRKYAGHEEVVQGIDYLPEKGLYVTGQSCTHLAVLSTSTSLRVWCCQKLRAMTAAGVLQPQ